MKLTLFAAAVGTLVRQPAPAAPPPFPSFAEHGEDWSGACALKDQQSPIDFDGPILGAPATGQPFGFSYPWISALDLENDGRAISGNVPGGGLFHPESGWHDLQSFRFRAEAEHTFGGKRAQLEMQLVHTKPNGQVLIMSVHFDTPVGTDPIDPSENVVENYTIPDPTGVGSSAFLDKLLAKRPPRMSEKVHLNSSLIDFNHLFDDAKYFEYAGSETMPSCMPVLWLVRAEPLAASPDQLARFRQALYNMSEKHGNWRWVQPLNGRPIIVRNGAVEKRSANPPASPYHDGPAYGPYMGKDDMEFKGDQMAKDVMTIEKYASDYAKDIDYRLQAGARARITEPAAIAPTGPPLGVPLDKSDPLYAIKALNNVQNVFRNAVDTSVSSDEIVAGMVNAANVMAGSNVRGMMTTAANQTQPFGGAGMHNALRGGMR